MNHTASSPPTTPMITTMEWPNPCVWPLAMIQAGVRAQTMGIAYSGVGLIHSLLNVVPVALVVFAALSREPEDA